MDRVSRRSNHRLESQILIVDINIVFGTEPTLLLDTYFQRSKDMT